MPRVDTGFRADFVVFSESRVGASGSDPHQQIGAFIPMSYMEESRLRIAAYKDLANAREIHEITAIEGAWRDRFGPLPSETENLLICQKIKILASRAQITQVEISSQRLMLTRNGDFILLSGKFPRLQKSKPAAKLREALSMLENL